MKNHELLDLIGEVNEDYVRAADGYAKRRRPVLRIGLIAACLGAFLLGTAFAAKAIADLGISDFVYDITGYNVQGDTYSGYFQQIDTFIPLNSLPDELRTIDAGGIIESEYFPTWGDAETFLGIDLACIPAMEGVRSLHWWGSGGNNHCRMYAFSRTSDEEEIAEINLMARYASWNESRTGYVPLYVSAYIFTEQAAEGTLDWFVGHTENGILTVHSTYPEDTAFTREDYVTPNGLNTVIIGVDADWDPTESRPVYAFVYQAYFQRGNVYYHVSAGEAAEGMLPCENPGDYNSYALEALKTFLDGFC